MFALNLLNFRLGLFKKKFCQNIIDLLPVPHFVIALWRLLQGGDELLI